MRGNIRGPLPKEHWVFQHQICPCSFDTPQPKNPILYHGEISQQLGEKQEKCPRIL
jgi:hypothetical protein